MPTFKFLNTETGEEFEDFISNSIKEELLKKNPHIRQVPSSFGIISGTGDVQSKTDDSWKEVLSKVAEAHPDSEVAKRYGKKSIKDIKTRDIVKKHRDKWKNR
jgi:hypothetical protein